MEPHPDMDTRNIYEVISYPNDQRTVETFRDASEAQKCFENRARNGYSVAILTMSWDGWVIKRDGRNF